MAQFAGVWKLESSENFEEFMKEIGVGLMLRKLGASAKPTITITVDGNHFTYKTESVKTNFIEFDLGKEFDETTADGRDCKSTVTLTPDGKLVQKQKSKNGSGPECVYTRHVEGDMLIAVAEANGVKCLRKFKRQN